jgi:N-acetylglucosamine kinase-like BadF-type ATPase
MSFLLALDGGQTGTRALLARVDGTVLGEGSGPPIRHMFAGGGAEARSAIAEAVRAAAAAARVETEGVLAAACGVTSVQPGSPEGDIVERSLRDIVGAERVVVVPDYVTNLLGASGGAPGVVVVAGGGSVAYGQARDGREAVAGGYGYLLGDEGGGYDIGRRAIAAAIHAEDGRGEGTALSDIVRMTFNLTALADIKRLVYVPQVPRERIAALVPMIVGAAAQGDAIAQRIMSDAGRDLAGLALAVIRRLFAPGKAVDVYPTGGVFGAGAALAHPFQAALEAGWPNARLCTPQHPPIMGALILARRLATGNIPHPQ